VLAGDLHTRYQLDAEVAGPVGGGPDPVLTVMVSEGDR
jgi:hypothetical protein